MNIKFNTDINIVKQDDLRLTFVSLLYPVGEIDFEHNYAYYIMRILMNCYSIDYPEESDFLQAIEERDIGKYVVDSFRLGKTRYLKITFTIPEEGIFEDFDLDKAFKLVHDNIYNSICNDVKYITDKKFNLEIDAVREQIERAKVSIDGLLGSLWVEQIDGEKKFLTTDQEDLEYLDKTTKEMVVEMYKNKILNNNFVTLVTGNIKDEDKFKETFLKYFKQETKEFDLDTEYDPIYEFNKKGEQVVNTKFNQSAVRMQFAKKNYSVKEKYILMMINVILNRNENNFLFNTLRLKYNLVYGCRSSMNDTLGSLIVTAYLSKDNIDICKKAIIETIDMLKDEEIFNEAKKKLIKSDQITLYSKLDNKTEKLNLLIDHIIQVDTFEDEFNILKEITFEEVKDFVDNLEIVNTLILVGDKND